MAIAAKTLVIGMGNTLWGDDGVGPAVVRQLCHQLGDARGIDLLEVETGGVQLMEVLEGYDRAFIIDAMVTGSVPPGTIRPFALREAVAAKKAIPIHDADLGAAFEMGRLLGLQVPDIVRVFGIEAAEMDVFRESLSDPVRAAVPLLVEELLRESAPAANSQ